MKRSLHLSVFSALCIGSLALASSVAIADVDHVVESGQTLAQIARKYNTSVRSLLAANSEVKATRLRPGQMLRVPEKGVIYVNSGQTLSAIANANGTSVGALAKLNKIKTDSSLKIGQRLVLPSANASVKRKAGKSSRGARGVVTLMRVGSNEKLTMKVLDSRGRVRNAAVRRFARMFRYHNTRRTRNPHKRLIRTLARISERFGGKPIQLVSGYRPPGGFTSHKSRHVQGRAADIRIPGVSNRVLRNYCRRLKNVGVGYYPRSTFVHVDVRGQNAYWVDVSRPGRRPRYLRSGESVKQAIAANRKGKKVKPKTSNTTKTEVLAVAKSDNKDEPASATAESNDSTQTPSNTAKPSERTPAKAKPSKAVKPDAPKEKHATEKQPVKLATAVQDLETEELKPSK